MEFTKLSEVEVVETANDTDKVLIEQNGEIKRVPKTEVGGKGGGNALIINVDMASQTFSANMSLDEALDAFSKQELTGAIGYFPSDMVDMPGGMMTMRLEVVDATPTLGSACIVLCQMMMDIYLYWTADGISIEPPM